MTENDKLFSIQWCAPADSTTHRLLLFAPNAELALGFAVEILKDKGQVLSVDELRLNRARAAAAGSR
jgi:hypothetical protein